MTSEPDIDHKVWSTVTEEDLLLGNGLRQVSGLIQTPGLDFSAFADCEFRLDPSWIADLGKKLLLACGPEHSSYHQYFSYRQKALLEYWLSSLKASALRDRGNNFRSDDNNSEQLQHEREGDKSKNSFTSQVSLLLLLPLLESQSRTDPALSSSCIDLLINFLADCYPNSLRQEPKSCLDGLEKLLCTWLESGDGQRKNTNINKEKVVSALIALACGRLSLGCFIRLLQILQKTKSVLSSIPGRGFLKRAIEYTCSGLLLCPSFLQTSYYLRCWKPELPSLSPDASASCKCPSVACNGKYIYMTWPSRKGLFKVGTGKQGTIRGNIYTSNPGLAEGWVAVNNKVVFRPDSMDSLGKEQVGFLLDPLGLEVEYEVSLRDKEMLESIPSKHKTLLLTSNGTHFFWIFESTTKCSTEGSTTAIHVLKFVLKICDQPGKSAVAVPVGRLVTLRAKKQETSMEVNSHVSKNLDGEKVLAMILKSAEKVPLYISSDMVIFVLPNYSKVDTMTTPGPLRIHSKNPVCCCFSLLDGSFVGGQSIVDSNAAVWQNLVVTGIGICCDQSNGLIYAYGNNWVSEWALGGIPNMNSIEERLCLTENTTVTCADSDDNMSADVALSSVVLITGLLCGALDNKLNTPNGHCNIEAGINMDKLLAEDLHSQVQALMCSEDLRHEIRVEACRLLVCGVPVFYPSRVDQGGLVVSTLEETMNVMSMLKRYLFDDMTWKIIHGSGSDMINLKLADDLVSKIVQACVKEDCEVIEKCATLNKEDFKNFAAVHPEVPPVQRFLTALVTKSWRDITHGQQDTSDHKHEVEALLLAVQIFNGCQKVLEVATEVIQKLWVVHEVHRVQVVDRVIKASLVGQVMPLLMTVMSTEQMLSKPLTKRFLAKVIKASLAATTAAQLYIKASRWPGRSSAAPLSSLPLPTPWAAPRVVETIHPLPDDYKLNRTVAFPGANSLYLTFDSRSSTQYEYDKVCVYSGPNTSSPKVGEFGGGSSSGTGNRGKLLRLGWPKETLKVQGDTVTLNFVAKSARELNTADEAVWGFACTISCKEKDNNEVVLPCLADVAFGLSVLTHKLLTLMYKGPPITEEEEACAHLLNSQLLQRCTWSKPTESVSHDAEASGIKITVTPEQDKPSLGPSASFSRPKLPSDVIARLRTASGVSEPSLRPSIGQALQPDLIHEVIISAVIRHLNLVELVHDMQLLKASDNSSPDYNHLCEVMAEVFRRTDGLVRQLQSMVELELRWDQELRDVHQGELHPSMAFFNEHHLQEAKAKELELLCYLKDVKFDPIEQEKVVGDLILKFENEAKSIEDASVGDGLLARMPKTRALRHSVIECAELLCNVTIQLSERKNPPGRSVSQGTFGSLTPELTGNSNSSPSFIRSLSAPDQLHKSISVQEGIPDLLRLQRWRTAIQKKTHPFPVNEQYHGEEDRTFVATINEIFAFIGSDPDTAETCSSFLLAARMRNERGRSRVEALSHMKDMVSKCCQLSDHVPHLLTAVASVISQGPGVEELACGGMVSEVRDAFCGVVQALLQRAATNPVIFSNSVVLMCTCPFSWNEERCLVRSGLLTLLDKLCALRRDRDAASRKVSAMAWASFQVLLNCLVEWENDGGHRSDEIEWSGLAYQVSMLITNYLTVVLKETHRDDKDALQYVLQLLQKIARSEMGRAILQQPCIASTLLSIFLDSHAPPKLVLSALGLCRVALPLMTAEGCDEVALPTSRSNLPSPDDLGKGTPVLEVASLLLTKLGEFVLPSAGHEGDREEYVEGNPKLKDEDSYTVDENTDTSARLYSLCVHKRSDQPAHEVVQKIISREGQRFMFRVGLGSEVERAVRIDHELSQSNRAEIMKGKFTTCLAKGTALCREGLVTSIVPSSVLHGDKSPEGVEGGGEPDLICKARNVELARDTGRLFINGQVANTLASEVISLLHSLLSSPDVGTSRLWTLAIQHVLTGALELVPEVIESLGDQIEREPEEGPSTLTGGSLSMYRQVMAALCTLGGFKQKLRPGAQAKICGEGMAQQHCEVISMSEGTASVIIFSPEGGAQGDITLEVPIARLQPVQEQVILLDKLGDMDVAIEALHVVLSARKLTRSVTAKEGPHDIARGMAAERTLSEIKTRASMVLASQMTSPAFCEAFSCHPLRPAQALRVLSEDSDPGQRLPVLESHCDELRMFYKDAAPVSRQMVASSKKIVLDSTRQYPPIQGVMFTEGYTSAHLLADSNPGQALPRGAYVYASSPLPLKAPSYYWEVEIVSLGEQGTGDYGAGIQAISVGLAPAQQPVDRWSSPIGTCVLHDNGIAVHYTEGGFTAWQTINTEVSLLKGHVIGCGYSRTDSRSDTGLVYFTHNGQRLHGSLGNVSAGLWPVVHLQKKDVRVRVNFGTRPFMYAKGGKIRAAADLASDSTEDVRESFAELPFAFDEGEDWTGLAEPEEKGNSPIVSSPKSTPTPLDLRDTTELRDYDPTASAHYMLSSSCDVMSNVGPPSHMFEDEPRIESCGSTTPVDLLVKAWEDRVFPVIRRRFRNEADRRSGLDQIRGALTAGLMEIAVATVSDLYEDNGGIPTSLTLPRPEDVQRDANKLTISNIKQGMSVLIADRTPETDRTPAYAIPAMKKTFGLVGIVQAFEKPPLSIVEVETYNHEEGILMRFWYPISALERAGVARGRGAVVPTGDMADSDLSMHDELLGCEVALARLYCRAAHTELQRQLLLQQGDVEDSYNEIYYLQSLAAHSLLRPQEDGGISVTSPHSVSTPRDCLSANNIRPSALFYSNPGKLRAAFQPLVTRQQGLTMVTDSICHALRVPVQGVWHREIVVGPSAQGITMSESCPGAAISVVSCRANPSYLTVGWVNSRRPLVTILCQYGACKLNKNGKVARYKAVQYPFIDKPLASSGDPGTYWTDMYPSRILPCNTLDVRVEDGAVDGPIVDVHFINPDVLFALVFIEVFTDCFQWLPEEADEKISRSTVLNILEILTCFLLKTALPAILRESIFHLLAELLRASHKLEVRAGTVLSREYTAPLTLILTRLSPLRTELQKLLEKEVSATTTSALDFVLKCNFENDKFSSYLQALFELVLATAEVTPHGRGRSGSLRERQGSITEALSQASSAESSPTGAQHFEFKTENAPSKDTKDAPVSSPPPTWHLRRRQSLRKRKRAMNVPEVLSPTDSMPWFDTVLSSVLLLQHLLNPDDNRGVNILNESLFGVVSQKSSVLQRLLVITNIPKTLSKHEALNAIKKACKPCGGVVMESLYLPETTSPKKSPTDAESKETLADLRKFLPSAQTYKPEAIKGNAVVELQSGSQLDLARQNLVSSKTLRPSGQEEVGIARVKLDLLMEGTNELVAFAVFDSYMCSRLFEERRLKPQAKVVLAEIFMSCVKSTTNTLFSGDGGEQRRAKSVFDKTSIRPADVRSWVKEMVEEALNDPDDALDNVCVDDPSKRNCIQVRHRDQLSHTLQFVTEEQMCHATPGNLLAVFMATVGAERQESLELAWQVLMEHGLVVSQEQGEIVLCLTKGEFLHWVTCLGPGSSRLIWKGLLACGYDISLERCTFISPEEVVEDNKRWSVAKDGSLIQFVDSLCLAMSSSPSRLCPDEIHINDADRSSEVFGVLRDHSLTSIRSRFAFLKTLNQSIEQLVLPLTDMRTNATHPLSTAALLHSASTILFYDTKMAFLKRMLDHSNHRGSSYIAPELSLDPLETIEVDKPASSGQFLQAAKGLSSVTSAGLRVKVATGGDPVFPLRVHLRGEQVLGSGGSFRHFMWLMARELQSPLVDLLMPCPSAAANRNKGKFILKPGPMTYSDEKLLIFFGQLLGISLRSDIPLAVDLMPVFWKSLLGRQLDAKEDLRATDILTYNYLRRFSEIETKEEFATLCFEADLCPYYFVYTSLPGDEVELCPDGADVPVTWENRREYVDAIRALRLSELRCEARIAAVQCGLYSVVPLHVLAVLSPADLETRMCGIPTVDLDFLKAHTTYVAGIKDTDLHIEYFWNALENFSQDQLRKFIKFACNQERLPIRCSCQEGNSSSVHVPPYPMKIGPPGGRGRADSRYIRVETCMFMIKLPPYSTQEIMTSKLLYAINCREDPLTDL
ncbi:probable E3 ubiquitin-protein ligase HECTD4 isoform X2 [Nematostella vectensis]|uniref:probable E3 ubiquitin-protein ligase HECTD4 isoform X2 n=1 Tax=Nematostella vectensis TaxID=45351 RepID=UPI0020772DA7|nr:probable E3 ubiquitin-protein ligase HECTD4 isoform X2 [Nematostella vectensis]